MHKLYSLLLLHIVFISLCWAQPHIDLVPYATGFQADISGIEHTNDGRLFVTEQLGYIRIIQPGGTVSSRPFLDIHNKVTPTVIDSIKEQGLLGLAFSPNYAEDGNFYVYYTNKQGLGNCVLSRYHVSADPDSADAASEEVLLTIYKPYVNHNGGCLKFGPEGYLYLSVGDGGKGGDPGNRAQNKDSLLGKILRLDVAGGGPYSIPLSNPFLNGGGAPEVWAYGLRNPWRFSFDVVKNDLWIADVGEQTMEEINFQPAFATGARNYGWRCYEGTLEFNLNGCGNPMDYVSPVYTYYHSEAGECSVTGGYVYRGRDYPIMTGYYFFTDYCKGVILSLSGDGNFTPAIAGDFSGKLFSTFGEDIDGELYVADHSTGTIYKIIAVPLAIDNYNKDISYSKVYPQPNSGSFTCEFNLAADTRLELEVSDATGRIIYQQKEGFKPGRNVLPLNFSDISGGTYFLRLKTAKGSTYHKILITT